MTTQAMPILQLRAGIVLRIIAVDDGCVPENTVTSSPLVFSVCVGVEACGPAFGHRLELVADAEHQHALVLDAVVGDDAVEANLIQPRLSV